MTEVLCHSPTHWDGHTLTMRHFFCYHCKVEDVREIWSVPNMLSELYHKKASVNTGGIGVDWVCRICMVRSVISIFNMDAQERSNARSRSGGTQDTSGSEIVA